MCMAFKSQNEIITMTRRKNLQPFYQSYGNVFLMFYSSTQFNGNFQIYEDF